MAINEKMVQMLPNGRLHLIPQAGHTTHLERPFDFAAAVMAFLSN
ncbi:MAG: hypothetical protein R3D55_25300 [Chloroflexota bacterium]